MSTVAQTGSTPTTTQPRNAFSTLSSEEFVRIMFSELANQDPLKPNDSSQVLEQMSQIRSIESDMQLQENLTTLVSQNQFASAGSMLGAFVSGLSDTNRRVEGLVQSISRTKDGPVLNLHTGARVPFGQVDEVIDPRDLSPAPNTPPPGPPNPNANLPTLPAPQVTPAPTNTDPVVPTPAVDPQSAAASAVDRATRTLNDVITQSLNAVGN
jgi:flagellar basal-body rod modification protein FlgD